MDRVALVNKVKTKIDEISTLDTPLQQITMADESPIDTIIESLLDESALEILLKAPFHRLPVTSATPTITPDPNDRTVGTIAVPDDFLRLVSFKMDDWQRSVTELAVKGDPISRRQANKHIRGGISRPVGVLSKNSSGVVIEYYSTFSETHSLSEFLYIQKTSAENITDNQMIEAMTWVCAGKVLSIIGNADDAKNAYDNAQSLMI